jgi:hypothetical protein
MPGLRHDPGQSAGYNAGSNRMWMVVDHDTGGVNSYNVCKNGRPGYDAGLCQILLPKVGIPWQFCEIDAICYHAGSAQYGNYNDDGPGFEVERLQGEPLSPDQTHWLGEINRWLAAEWGVPNVHYWGPQFPWRQADFHGHVNHRDIHPNPDGLSQAEWDAVTGSTGGNFTVGQMEDIAQWEKDTRKIILDTVGQWEQDTRAYVDKQIKASEARIIAAINAR